MVLSLAMLLKVLTTGMSGALGAGARHAISTHARHRYGDRFPWGTLAINLTGALLIGFLSALMGRFVEFQSSWHAPLVLGFLGGYTTFSTLMLESARLRRKGDYQRMMIYLGVSIILGPLVAFTGLALGRWV